MNFSSPQDSVMEINGCYCVFNSPKAKKDSEAPTLPPYAQRSAFLVDEYPGCPTGWLHGSSKAKSYFVPIQAGHGLWLDFNKNSTHTHHIAVLVSIQGVNPLTGMPLIDTAMRLEQYKHKCPKHDKEFGADRFCSDCGYKWVPQNYLATTAKLQSGALWLDGFRGDDGNVYQYYFTEEEAKGIAAQVIGDKRVYAIGIAFYQSKEPKPKEKTPEPRVYPYYKGGVQLTGGIKWKSDYDDGLKGGLIYDMPKVTMSAPRSHRSDRSETLSSPEGFEVAGGSVKQLEIGAGAKINQRIYADPESVDFWEDSPLGMLYINYVLEDDAKRIIAVGKKDMTKNGKGFLADLVVGNS